MSEERTIETDLIAVSDDGRLSCPSSAIAHASPFHNHAVRIATSLRREVLHPDYTGASITVHDLRIRLGYAWGFSCITLRRILSAQEGKQLN